MNDLPNPLTPAQAPASREEAIERGSRRYFTGTPCPAGHIAERYTLNGYCVECQHEANRQDRERARAKMDGTFRRRRS
ncbi:MAG: hypothetical protein EPN70_03405 [Paraburkholderia sp.]|nr:MAG: hypothetical protein EPN70_03405 [Paraburkholderia sp.]TAM32630.1 MAG: hypothetical protein EPN59_01655 [Paraburkholderia sp.]